MLAVSCKREALDFYPREWRYAVLKIYVYMFMKLEKYLEILNTFTDNNNLEKAK